MLILYETPAGYALFKCLKEGKTEKVDDIMKYFASADKAKSFVSL
jgi:nucleolar protein 58